LEDPDIQKVDEKKLNLKSKQPGSFILAALLLAVSIQPGLAQEAQTPEESGTSTAAQFGGPNSVQDQLADDARPKDSLTDRTMLQDYFNWKDDLRKEHGLSFSIDYTAGVLAATNTLGGEDIFASGAVRFYGSWDLIGRESGNTGSFVWKIEHRHRYTDIPVSGTAPAIGYAGAILSPLSNVGTRLTNLYWKQNLNEGRLEVIAGMLDTTDWVDLYAFASPWNGFFNFAFATGGAAMALPDDAAIGAYVNAMITDNLYIIGGFADSNADSTDPLNGFDTFFNDREYFKTIELGWTTSRERFYLDNTHLTLWHADDREKAGVPSAWGANFSFAHAFDDKWMPFVRAGYADGGGSLLQKTVSAGLGYHLKDDVSLLGLGFHWGQPNEDTFGPGLEDQYVIELFSRLQVTQNLQVTPDIQFIINPALNPQADQSLVLGVRARLAF
jgi:porin